MGRVLRPGTQLQGLGWEEAGTSGQASVKTAFLSSVFQREHSEAFRAEPGCDTSFRTVVSGHHGGDRTHGQEASPQSGQRSSC